MKKDTEKHMEMPAEKIQESVALLANGIADDFNNILTTVMGACSLIDRDEPANEELIECVSLIRASAEHAAVLSGQLMHVGAVAQETTVSHDDTVSLRGKAAQNNIAVPENNSGDDKI